jgi:hypothetical protein
MSAQSLIADLASTAPTGVFPGISSADVVAGLRERLADATKIDTSNVNLCGPAALFYCVLQDKPELYVKFVIDLFTSGSARLGTISVTPGDDCRNARPDRAKIAPVDWIALASLRDSENSVLDFDSVDAGAAGITMPNKLADWFTACGYTQVRNVTNVFFTKGRSELDTLHQLVLQHRRVCLFVNTNMLQSKNNTSRSFSPNHWVVLISGGGVSNDSTSVKVFSWGDTPTVSLSVDNFSKNFYGFVSAMAAAAS